MDGRQPWADQKVGSFLPSSADRLIDTGYLPRRCIPLQPTLTDPGAVDTSPATCYQFLLHISCSALLLQHAVVKIANITRYSHIAWWNAYELGRTTVYLLKATLNCEYRIIQKKKLGKNYKTKYNMSYEGCDVMLRYLP